jgi:hypothetical protein
LVNGDLARKKVCPVGQARKATIWKYGLRTGIWALIKPRENDVTVQHPVMGGHELSASFGFGHGHSDTPKGMLRITEYRRA